MRRGIFAVALAMFLVLAFSPGRGFSQADNLSFLDRDTKYDLIIALSDTEVYTLKRVLVVDVATIAGRDFLVLAQTNGLARDTAFIAVESVEMIIPSTSKLRYTK